MRKHRLGGSLSSLVLIAVAGCGGGAGNHDYSSAIVRSIEIKDAPKIQRATNGLGRSGTATIKDASCFQTAGTQSYSCIVEYTYQNSEGIYRYRVNVSATCNSGGTCRWHVDGGGTLVSAEPD